jgi:hypothetical protein
VNRRSPGWGELVAGAGGALLLVATFLPWFALDAAIELPGRSGGVTVRGEGVNAWEAFAVIDLLLLATALAAIALAALAVSGLRRGRIPLALAVIAAAVVSGALIVFRLLDPPDLVTAADTAATETGRRIGAFFALLASVGIAWGAWRSIEDQAVGEEPAAKPELRPEPEPEAEPEPGPVPEPEPEPEPVRRAGPPVRSAGVAEFEALVGRLEPLLEELWGAPAAPRSDHGRIPAKPGVYLFTRNDEPVHVGQAPDLRRRLAEQCRPSSGHTKATLAFEIAKRAAAREGVSVDGPPARLATSDDFSPFFTRAKEAVADLPVRYLEVESRELRTLFEVYGSLALGTTESASDAA